MMEHFDPEADAYEPGFEMKTKQALNAEAETRRTVRRMLYGMLLAAAILLTFHSGALLTYVRGLPIGTVEDTIIALTQAWHEQMEKNGATVLFAEMREWFQGVHDATWDDVEEAVSGPKKSGETPEDMRGGVSG